MSVETEALDRLVARIVASVRPLRVVLFGSAARGDWRQGSDLDVLIVVPEGTHRRHTAQQLYCELSGIGVPYDLVVATPGDLERHKDNPNLIYSAILREGITMYAA